MLCENCHKKPATVHITKIINDQQTEQHLCEECAREQQGLSDISIELNFSIPQLLASLLGQGDNLSGKLSVQPLAMRRCPTCSLSYKRFGQEGKFGCRNCYREFADRLDPLFRKIHGNSRHMGKVPIRGSHALNRKRQLEDLRTELQAAVGQEDYELAAVLRDRIRDMEEQGPSGGGEQ